MKPQDRIPLLAHVAGLLAPVNCFGSVFVDNDFAVDPGNPPECRG